MVRTFWTQFSEGYSFHKAQIYGSILILLHYFKFVVGLMLIYSRSKVVYLPFENPIRCQSVPLEATVA
jgi:hypothetical protein